MDHWGHDTGFGKLKYSYRNITVLFCPTKTSYAITWEGTRAYAMRGRRFTEENKPKLYINMRNYFIYQATAVSTTLCTHISQYKNQSPFVIGGNDHRSLWGSKSYLEFMAKKCRDIHTIRSCVQRNYRIVQS
jgi:hypothetical protein